MRGTALFSLPTNIRWLEVWKHNFEIFQVMMAWQDPNKVPIKAFYEGVTNAPRNSEWNPTMQTGDGGGGGRSMWTP